jgi:hypothetical protein
MSKSTKTILTQLAMNEIKYFKGWDNFNYNLYLAYLQAKFAKEETEYLAKQDELKSLD